MKRIRNRYKEHSHDHYFQSSVLIGIIALVASLFINYYASLYASTHAGNTVPDIILSNIPTYDVRSIFLFCPLILWIFFSLRTFVFPKRIPFTLKTIALFIITRSIFVTLTHLGPYTTNLTTEHIPWGIQQYTFAGDLFFSAHTGFPFLMALLFWHNKKLRLFFVACSVFFGVVVLLGHYHYSIDVLAAFFITYAIVDMAKFLFKKDYARFQQAVAEE